VAESVIARGIRIGTAMLVGVVLAAFVPLSTAQAAGTMSISGNLFEDIAGDGVRNPSDGPFGGLCNLRLHAVADGANATTDQTSQTYNTFSFTGLAPGQYQLSADCHYSRNYPSALTATDTTPNPVDIELTTASQSGIDMGFFKPPWVFGQVFADRNADGVRQADEPGINGCTVTVDRGIDGKTDDTGMTMTGKGFDAMNGVDQPGMFFATLQPGRTRLGASCPGLGPPTVRPGDIAALSGQDLGGLTGPSGTLPPPLFGFDPTPVTTTRATTGTTIASAGVTSSTVVTSASTSSTPSSTTQALSVHRTSSGGGNGTAIWLGALIAVIAGAAAAVLIRRRQTGISADGPDQVG
jgi:hypothetical protein